MKNRILRQSFSFTTGMMLVLILAGCAPAHVTHTWRDPSLTGPMHFKKIVVLVLHPDRTVRKIAEDEMVTQIGADRAVAGYTVVTDDDRKHVEIVKSKLQQAGFDGAITLKPAGTSSRGGYVSGPEGMETFSQAYDNGVSVAADSESYVSDRIICMRTNIYSVADGKLIWSATTDLTNPTDARAIVADVVKSVSAELRKQKLIQ